MWFGCLGGVGALVVLVLTAYWLMKAAIVRCNKKPDRAGETTGLLSALGG